MSSREPFKKKQKSILGRKMNYVDEGSGDPIVLLHGNPTSSYLWRNIIPHLTGVGRCIAPDLIGMGDSEKLKNSGPDSYTFVEHRRYLDKLLEDIGVSRKILFVIHDWGSSLGFDWAYRHKDSVKGIAYMEAIVCPMTWDDFPETARGVFQGFRSPAGEDMILDKNIFVELILPGSILRKLTDEEMDEYRRPYLTPGENRRPTLTWPRQLPIEGEPQEVVDIVKTYGDWLTTSNIPKLFINADPGAILTGRQRDFCRNWPNQEEITVKGNHFIQEDSPDEIGIATAEFIKKIRK
ncbi:MAG: haloalkane dehalogenase [Desulfobacterales bacterium]|nr:haloalkane dehalogenase [Desulfobacterales bacterium]